MQSAIHTPRSSGDHGDTDQRHLMSTGGLVSVLSKVYNVTLSWFARRRELGAPENQLHVLLDEAYVHIDAVDNGAIEIKCKLVNLSKRAWELDHLEISLWTIEDYAGPRIPHWLTIRGSIPARTIASSRFTLKLGSPEVRHTINYMKSAECSLANRGTKIRVEGQMIFRSGRRMAHIPISLDSKSSNVHLPERVIKAIKP